MAVRKVQRATVRWCKLPGTRHGPQKTSDDGERLLTLTVRGRPGIGTVISPCQLFEYGSVEPSTDPDSGRLSVALWVSPGARSLGVTQTSSLISLRGADTSGRRHSAQSRPSYEWRSVRARPVRGALLELATDRPEFGLYIPGNPT